jgi:phage gp45-like
MRAYTAGGARSVVSEVADKPLMQEMKGNFMKGETRGEVEAPQNYGFTSVCRDGDKGKDGSVSMGPEAFINFIGGNRSFPVCMVMDDRRFRLKELEKGDVAFFDYLQHQFHFNKDGVFLTGRTDKKMKFQLAEPPQEQQQQSGGGAQAGTFALSQQGSSDSSQGQQSKAQGQTKRYQKEAKQFMEITKNTIEMIHDKIINTKAGETIANKAGQLISHIAGKHDFTGDMLVKGFGEFTKQVSAAAPTLAKHLATKGYVDSLIGGGGGGGGDGGGDGGGGIPEAPIDGLQYGRQNATWTPVTAADVGPVTVTNLIINKPASGTSASIQGQISGTARWQVSLGDVLAESGNNTGSDFRINRYNDAGDLINVPLWIRRDTGVVTITGSPPPQQPLLSLNKTASGQAAAIAGQKGTVARWAIGLGDGDVEGGGNSGSNYRIHRYDDNGSFLSAAQYILRNSGDLYQFNQCFKPGGGFWSDSSDERIKTVEGDYTQGLAAVLALHPVRYKYKGNDVQHLDPSAPVAKTDGPDPSSGHYTVAVENKEFIGLIGQEAELHMPEMVTSVPAKIDGVEVSDFRIMDTTALIYALVNCIKELNARLEAVENA